MIKYRLSKANSLRSESPLAKIDFNRPESISPEHYGKIQGEGITRQRAISTRENTPPHHHIINLSHYYKVEGGHRPKVNFSSNKKIQHQTPSTKYNLMITINVKAKCGIPTQRVNRQHLQLIQNPEERKTMCLKDFVKIRQLGRGKFGTVWLVVHKKTQFLCALKIISKAVIREEKVVHQVAKEIRIHNSLEHQNVINFYGFFADRESFYIVTEYATQGHLFGQLKKHHRLEERDVKKYVKQTVEGVNYIHSKGYIHRDIKPENLLLQFETVKICDFGWAAECSHFDMRQSQCGTPLYYSPEMVKNDPHNSKIDIWSIGLLAYELIVGRVPFKIWSQFDLPVILKQEVTIPNYIDFSESLQDFVLKCLVKDHRKRPSLWQLQFHPFISSENQQLQPLITETNFFLQ